MKANKLMIGDLVKDVNDGEIILAYELGSNEILCSDYFYRCYDELEPIPITAEILEKNGFKELTKIIQPTRVKNFRWVLKVEDIRVEDIRVEAIEVTPNVFQITIHRELSDLSDERVNIRYVHELQHALRLCGLNELADNFKL